MSGSFKVGDRVRSAVNPRVTDGTITEVDGAFVCVRWPDCDSHQWWSGDWLVSLAPPVEPEQPAAFAAEHEAAKWIDSPALFGVDRSGGLGAADHAAREVDELRRAHAFFKERCEKLDLEVSRMPDERRRANELSDLCGALETEKRGLLVENATLRRRVEVLERDAKRGRR